MMKARLWAYPWDLLDDGLDVALSRIATTGVQEVSLATSYHGAMLLLPHNPRRRVYFLEDGVVYFRPDERFYQGTPIKPVPSNLTADLDPLAVVAESARAHGLDTVAWTVTLHNSRLGMAYPEYTVQNAFGDRYPYALCPAQPAVVEFVCGLVRDLSTRYPLSTVEVEALYYGSYPHAWTHAKEGVRKTPLQDVLLSLCFCPACLNSAGPYVDGVALRERVRELLNIEFDRGADEQPGYPDPTGPGDMEAILPGFAAYTAMRTEVVTQILAKVRSACQVKLGAVVGSGVARRAWASGVDPAAFARTCDSLTFSCYHADAATVQQEASFARSLAGDTQILAGLHAIWPLAKSSGDFIEKVVAAQRGGANGVSIYNYGLMPLPHLAWIKRALEVSSW